MMATRMEALFTVDGNPRRHELTAGASDRTGCALRLGQFGPWGVRHAQE